MLLLARVQDNRAQSILSHLLCWKIFVLTKPSVDVAEQFIKFEVPTNGQEMESVCFLVH